MFRANLGLIGAVLLLAALGAGAPTAPPPVGVATYYAPGVMEAVVANRLAWGQVAPCQECVGTVALLDAGQLGRRVWLQAPGRPPEGPFLVVDCAQQAHRAALLAQGWVVDVDWATAQRWGMRGPLSGVRVFLGPEGASG